MVNLGCFIKNLLDQLATITVLSLVLAIPSICAEAPPPPIALRTHNVGGVAGWFFDTSTNTTSADYSHWAASETFYVGDFLIFTSYTNASLVQTNNETMYKLCDATNYVDDETIHWSNYMDANSSSTTEDFAVPLTDVGPNYIFSADMDGEQCRMGMKFGINVLDGQPPPSAILPPPSAYAIPPPVPTGGGGGTSKDNNNGVEVMRGGMVWVGFGFFSLVVMAV